MFGRDTDQGGKESVRWGHRPRRNAFELKKTFGEDTDQGGLFELKKMFGEDTDQGGAKEIGRSGHRPF